MFLELGFSAHEALVYKLLLKEGSMDVKKIAKSANVLPNALYRLLLKLQNKGLITVSGSRPALYKAITPSIALDNYITNKIHELESFRSVTTNRLQITKKDSQTRIDLIKDAHDFFLEYARAANQTKEEILIISIGESVPEEVMLANRDAIQRGVTIRFIVHKLDQDNRDLLLSWRKMGLLIRYFPDWGFHLVVFDNTISLLSINNPDRTSERIALMIYSRGLSKAYADYFNSTWNKAKEIE